MCCAKKASSSRIGRVGSRRCVRGTRVNVGEVHIPGREVHIPEAILNMCDAADAAHVAWQERCLDLILELRDSLVPTDIDVEHTKKIVDSLWNTEMDIDVKDTKKIINDVAPEMRQMFKDITILSKDMYQVRKMYDDGRPAVWLRHAVPPSPSPQAPHNYKRV